MLDDDSPTPKLLRFRILDGCVHESLKVPHLRKWWQRDLYSSREITRVHFQNLRYSHGRKVDDFHEK